MHALGALPEMACNKSLDEFELIATLLHDVHTSCGAVFNTRALRLTLQKARRRFATEGLGFLTKSLPRLGKAFDKALSLAHPLNSSELRFKPQLGSQLPRFLGELFNEVLAPNGLPLSKPNIECVRAIRQICTSFYKYKLPYSNEEEQEIISKFERTERDISSSDIKLERLQRSADGTPPTMRLHHVLCCKAGHCDARRAGVDSNAGPSCVLPKGERDHVAGTPTKQEVHLRTGDATLDSGYRPGSDRVELSPQGDNSRPFLCSVDAYIVRKARRILSDLLAFLDPADIYPRHGPGAVATKQQLEAKYVWSNVASRITQKYPLDAYFYACLTHFCDKLSSIDQITDKNLPARVVLVPKDSRGPRLISCEPVDFQWVQQGLSEAIVATVESHDLTKYNVFFTNQQPNQFGALLGSSTGMYSTLDLNEASDRVSLRLVHLLFPPHICEYLEAARSSSTVLPDGRELTLRKFAPMGSSLCFPILALTIWAILTAGAPNAFTRERILVYGDDVIVPTAYAENAIEHLESFGLKLNRDKSCIKGFFRESCGIDAFQGVNVTPIKFRSVWSSSPSPESFLSWVAYANSCYERKYFLAYDYIVGGLIAIYGSLPTWDQLPKESGLSVPEVPEQMRPVRHRYNSFLQRKEYRVRVVEAAPVKRKLDGWSSLLRYFAEKGNSLNHQLAVQKRQPKDINPYLVRKTYQMLEVMPFSVGSYTRRGASKLAHRWR